MTLTLPAFLDALVADLKSGSAPTPWLTYNELANALTKARAKFDEHPAPALGWSGWLDRRYGDPCFLPPGVAVEWEDAFGANEKSRSDVLRWDGNGRDYITRFRYREQYPGGWLPRGDFIPPAALWDEACPVRCEWTRGLDRAAEPGRNQLIDPAYWEGATHIRLRPREKAGEMPDGWWVNDVTGNLISPDGTSFLRRDEAERLGHDTIRRAVDAWLASMKERGNG